MSHKLPQSSVKYIKVIPVISRKATGLLVFVVQRNKTVVKISLILKRPKEEEDEEGEEEVKSQ